MGAGLANLAVPPFDIWPAALLCWVPLVAVVHRAKPRLAVLCGLLHGVLTHIVGFRWVPRAIHDAMDVSWPTAVLALLTFSVLQGGRTALIALLASRAKARGWPLIVSFAPALVTAELLYPMFLPWHSALFVYSAAPLVQVAEVGGPLAVSAWLAVANVGFWLAVERWRKGARTAAARAVVVTLVAVALIGTAGGLRMRRVREVASAAASSRVGVVQRVIRRGDDRDPLDVHREASLALLRSDPHVDLLVWPETAIATPISANPSELSRFFRTAVLRDSRVTEPSESITVPLLTGAVLERRSRKGSRELFNAAILVDPAGRPLGAYDKRELAPIGEATPMGEWVPGLEKLVPPKTPFARGSSDGGIEVGGRRIGVSICYEDILYRTILATVERSQPNLLVNLTSDAWFGDSPASELHLALATLRAVEHRRQLLRVTTDGVTALVEPTGEVIQRLPRRAAATGVVRVRWLSDSTPFDAIGDSPWWIVALLTVAASFVKAPRPFSGPERQGPA